MGFTDLVDTLVGLMNTGVTLLILLAFVLFFFHTSKGIFGEASDGAGAKSDLKQTLFWGIIIIFVMLSIGGILGLISSEFDLAGGSFLN